MPKKLLMIADADSFWTMRLLKHFILPHGYEVTLFPIWGNGGKYADFFRENNVTVYADRHKLPVIRHIPRIRMWARVALNARDLRSLGPFDVVHNNYLSQRDLALGASLAKCFGARFIASFWGSDLMRASKKALADMKPYLEQADAISVHNKRNVGYIREIYGEDIAKKTQLLYFGQTGFDSIDSVKSRLTVQECKKQMGIDENRFVLCAGYSASTAQQQLDIVKALADLPAERLEKIALVIQQSYGENDPAYSESVRNAAQTLPCQTVILRDFLNDEQSAILHLCADVYIHAIRTDAFSASMQEYYYAGACVLTGAWLDYPQLRELGIEVHSFDAFDALPALVSEAMDGKIGGIGNNQKARLAALSSWKAVTPDWEKLYDI